MKATLHSIQKYLQNVQSIPWLAEALAVLGALWAAFQLWGYALTRDSVLDEGAYLYKGYLYASGQYQMYQPYGPWNYHMPLAYLIPGVIQKIFGPGLAAGRIFSIVLALLTFLGLWLLIRRIKGRWWAVTILWLYILNPATLKTFSLAVSQVLIACMLVWMVYLILGDHRPDWMIITGSFLAGTLVITRLNMLPVLPLAVMYIFWQSGLKKSIFVLLAGVFPIIIVHIWFWPDILQVWGWWLPRGLTPFLENWRIPEDYQRFWNPKISVQNQVASFFMAFRFHFTALVAALASILLWPRREQWQKVGDFRAAVFTTSLLVVLFLFHLWAALGKNYCVQCLTAYTAFYSFLGLVILAQSFEVWRKQVPTWRGILSFITILIISTGIGFSALEDLGARILDLRLPVFFSDPLSLSFETERLRRTLSTRYDLSNLQQRIWVSAAVGALMGAATILLGILLNMLQKRMRGIEKGEEKTNAPSIAYSALLFFLVVGIILTPTFPLGGGPYAYDCSGDALSTYKTAGEHLANLIPSGSKIFWAGELSAVPLLYITDSQTFSPLIEGSYSRYVGGDKDTLLRFGLWNEEIAREWAGDADYLLIKERYLEGWLKELVESGKFDELEPTPPVVDCRNDSRIHIFQRLTADQ